MSRVVKIDSAESFSKGVDEAVEIISEGGTVSFPTESFYGLGVDATNPAAVKKIFAIKKRERHLPLLILLSSMEELAQYVQSIPAGAIKMGKQFWPGGLTMIFDASQRLPLLLTAGKGKVGIRISSHPLPTALSQASHIPITGTSANVSGTPACTTAQQVIRFLGNHVDLILDGGATSGKKPSTVLDVTVDPPLLLREGIISAEEILSSTIYETITRPG